MADLQGNGAKGELSLLLRLAQAVNQASTLEQVFPPALEAVTAGLGVSRAAILLLDEAGVMRFRGWRGLSEAYRQAVDGHSPWTREDRSPPPILVDDVETGPSVATVRPALRAEGIRSLAFIPLVERGALLGKFMVYGEGLRRFTGQEVWLAQAIASQVAQGVARAQLYERERRLRALAERSAERNRILRRVTGELSSTLRPDEVAEVVIREGVQELGAYVAGLWWMDAHRGRLALLRARHDPDGVLERFREIALDAPMPLAEAVRSGAPVWLRSWEEYRSGFPDSQAHSCDPDRGDKAAIACLPLMVEGRAQGGLMFAFHESRPFDEAERVFVQVLSQQCAQALERSRLYLEGEAARERAAFLANAGVALSSSLDYQQTLRQVAKLAVPAIADWVAVEVTPSGDWAQASRVVEHADPRKVEPALEYRRRFPMDRNVSYGVPAVLRTGRSELYPEVGDPEQRIRDPEQRRWMSQLEIRSVMIVPVEARGRVFGAITFNSTQPGRFTAQDLEMAEQLGRRAGLAIENALLYEQAVKAVGLRDDFLSIAGHELKTPLTALMFHVQSLPQLIGSPEKVQERAEKLLRNAQRLAKLIDELLDVSRITSGRLKLEVEEVQLGPLVREVVARLSEDAARARVDLRLIVEEGVRGTWDRARLEQVVTNLLTNAFKYGAGKLVEAAVEASAPGARLRVKDHGIGIAPEDQARIFERFERAVSARQFGGLGLGLWIARQIIEAHGGTIAVRSQPGEGAEFTVDLPLEPPERSGP